MKILDLSCLRRVGSYMILVSDKERRECVFVKKYQIFV